MKDFDVYKVHQDIYEYMVGKKFIITHEYQFRDGHYEPCGRPALCSILGYDMDKKKLQYQSYDYDQECQFDAECDLPQNFACIDFGNLCFKQVFEHKGRNLVVRYWEA